MRRMAPGPCRRPARAGSPGPGPSAGRGPRPSPWSVVSGRTGPAAMRRSATGLGEVGRADPRGSHDSSFTPGWIRGMVFCREIARERRGDETASSAGDARQFFGNSDFGSISTDDPLSRVVCRWAGRISVARSSGRRDRSSRPRPPLAEPHATHYTAWGAEAGRLPRHTRRGPIEATWNGKTISLSWSSSTPHPAWPH
jgi:hypothetical protein